MLLLIFLLVILIVVQETTIEHELLSEVKPCIELRRTRAHKLLLQQLKNFLSARES